MNGTPIDNIRRFQQPNLPNRDRMTGDIMTGDEINDDREDNNIDILAKEVSDNIDELDMQPEHPRHVQKVTTVQKEKQKDTFMSRFPEFMREPAIIVVIYVILSLDIVKKTLSNYIPQIKPTDGGVAFVGIIVYALILAIGFMVAKKLLL